MGQLSNLYSLICRSLDLFFLVHHSSKGNLWCGTMKAAWSQASEREHLWASSQFPHMEGRTQWPCSSHSPARPKEKQRSVTQFLSISWMNLNTETKIWGNNGINFHGPFVKQNCSSCRQGLAALLIPKFYFWKTDSKDQGVSKAAYRCHSWRLQGAQHLRHILRQELFSFMLFVGVNATQDPS